MNENTTSVLMERITALERRLVCWQRGTLVIFLIALTVPLAGLVSQPDKVVVAQRFILKDANGEIKAIFGEASVEAQEEVPSEPNDKFLASLGGWGVHLYNSNREVVRLTDGWLSVTSPQRQAGGGFYVSVSDKTALLQMVTPGKEKKELRLQLDPEYGTNITLSSNDSTRVVLGETDLKNSSTETTLHRPLSSLVLFGKDGKVVSSLPR